MNKRFAPAKSRRDIFWVFGICAALLLPFYLITRAKTPTPTLVKPKRTSSVILMQLSPNGVYLATVERRLIKTKETIAEASKEINVSQLIVYRTADMFPLLRHTIEIEINQVLQWERDSKKLALVGREARIWKAPKFVVAKVPTAPSIKLKSGKVVSLVRQTWVSLDSDLEVQWSSNSDLKAYRLSTGAPVPLAVKWMEVLRRSGVNWTMALEPRAPGLAPRAVLVEQFPGINYHTTKKVQNPKNRTSIKTRSKPLAAPDSLLPGRVSESTLVSVQKMEWADVSLIDLTSGQRVWKHRVPRWVFVPTPLFSPDGKSLVLAGTGRAFDPMHPNFSRNRGVDLLDPRTGKTLRELDSGKMFNLPGFPLEGIGFYGNPSVLVMEDWDANARRYLRRVDAQNGIALENWPNFTAPFTTDASGSNWIFMRDGLLPSKSLKQAEIEALVKTPQPTP